MHTSTCIVSVVDYIAILILFLNKRLFSHFSFLQVKHSSTISTWYILPSEMPAERLIVILERVWISWKWQFRDSCSLKWLISFTDEQKWLQMTPGMIFTIVSLSGYTLYVCVVSHRWGCCCHCVSWLLLLYVSLAWVIWCICLSAACYDKYFSSPGLLYTNL